MIKPCSRWYPWISPPVAPPTNAVSNVGVAGWIQVPIARGSVRWATITPSAKLLPATPPAAGFVAPILMPIARGSVKWFAWLGRHLSTAPLPIGFLVPGILKARFTAAPLPGTFTVAGVIRALFQGAAATADFTVAGILKASFLGTNSPIVFWVKGKLTATFTGTNQAFTESDFQVNGQITASFTQGVQESFIVAGQLQVSFFGIGGQNADCITGSPLEVLTPNYVH